MRTIEICCGSVAEAKLAHECGAARVELCSALALEGITPSIAVVSRTVSECAGLQVHVLIRPREGGFVYSHDEITTMIHDILAVKAVGAHGVVIGALTESGEIDIDACQRMIAAAKPELSVTFHRAFDVCANPLKALRTLIGIGCDRVLTSGQAPSAAEGAALLRTLVQEADGKIIVMPGGGINADNIADLQRATGAIEFHASARKKPAGYKPSLAAAFATGPLPTTDPDQVRRLATE